MLLLDCNLPRPAAARMTDQIVFETTEFANNPEPRCPCLLVLDTSASMAGARIDELNAGLAVLRQELMNDVLAMKRVEVGIVTFGPTKVEQGFESAVSFTPPLLTAQGDTPMGSAIELAIELVRGRKQEYRANGISYYRPWIFLITDGAPTDSWVKAMQLVHDGERDKAFAFFPIGVQGANQQILAKISKRTPLTLEGLRFRELFSWLSSSLRSVSRSTPGTEFRLESPSGWASV